MYSSNCFECFLLLILVLWTSFNFNSFLNCYNQWKKSFIVGNYGRCVSRPRIKWRSLIDKVLVNEFDLLHRTGTIPLKYSHRLSLKPKVSLKNTTKMQPLNLAYILCPRSALLNIYSMKSQALNRIFITFKSTHIHGLC